MRYPRPFGDEDRANRLFFCFFFFFFNVGCSKMLSLCFRVPILKKKKYAILIPVGSFPVGQASGGAKVAFKLRLHCGPDVLENMTSA